MSGSETHWVIALIYGMALIVIFSYERFNRLSFDGGRKLERLLGFLTPDKLRAKRKVRYAYFLYTVILIFIYLVLCAYAEVMGLGFLTGKDVTNLAQAGATGLPTTPAAEPSLADVSTGFAPYPEGKAPEIAWIEQLKGSEVKIAQTTIDKSISPEVSLTVAMILVGLSPAVPMIARIDDWLRYVTHKLAGIPTWVIDAGELLHAKIDRIQLFGGTNTNEPSDNKEINDYLLIGSEYREMENVIIAQQSEGFSRDILSNLQLICIALEWFIQDKLNLSRNEAKQGFIELENALNERIQNLFVSIKNLNAASTSESNSETQKLVSAEAEHLASDICILIALYREHGVLNLPQHLSLFGGKKYQKAHNALNNFTYVLDINETVPAKRLRRNNVVLFWSIGIIFTWTFVWAAFGPGSAEYELQRGMVNSDPYVRIFWYMATAVNTYFIALLAALTFRWTRITMLRPGEGIRTWHSMNLLRPWTKWLPQATSVLVITWLSSILLMMALQIWQSGLLSPGGWADLDSSALKRLFEYNAPISIRAAIFSLLTLIVLDSFDTPEKSKNIPIATWKLSIKWGFLGASIMCCASIVTRYMSFVAGSQLPGGTARAYDYIDTGLMIWSALFCTILGGAVLYCASEALAKIAQEDVQRKAMNDASQDKKQIEGHVA